MSIESIRSYLQERFAGHDVDGLVDALNAHIDERVAAVTDPLVKTIGELRAADPPTKPGFSAHVEAERELNDIDEHQDHEDVTGGPRD